MKKIFIVCMVSSIFMPALANYTSNCRNVFGTIQCDTTPSYGANWGNSFLSGFNSGMQWRQNQIAEQNARIQQENALLQQQILQQQIQQQANMQQNLASCKINKIVGQEFPMGRSEVTLTFTEKDKYRIDGTKAYILTTGCDRYIEHTKVIVDNHYGPSDKIYFLQ